MRSKLKTAIPFVPWAARWTCTGCVILMLSALSWLILHRATPPSIDEARAELRRRYLAELEATNRVSLATYGWIDSRRGIVRLPLDRAIEMSVELWQNPAMARSNLLDRLSKATAKLPPKPNIYE